LTKRLTELETKEENLLDLVEDGGTNASKVRGRLVAIGEERARVKAELEAQGPLLEAGAALITAALDLLDNPQELKPANHRSGETTAQPSLLRQALPRR
jgi:hypothetical protein